MNSKFNQHNIRLLLIFVILTSGCASKQYFYPEPDIRLESMKKTIQYLTSIDPPRNYEHPVSMIKASEFILQEFKKFGLNTREQKFIVSEKIYRNIIANAGPRDGSRLIIGAHYDVCGSQPGADDNASAVAGLLEIARFAKTHESRLPYGIEFVAYTLEEPPFFGTKNMGSYVHAESLRKGNVNIKGMICLEMIGFFTDEKKSQSYPLGILKLFYPTTGNFIGIVSNYGSSTFANQIDRHMRRSSIDVSMLKAPSFIHGLDFSDHRNYWKFGYDAVMVTDTAFYRNTNYHQDTDTIDTLDFNKMREVVKGICWAVFNIE
ncbi:MAG: M28 family peptidase [Spirochaetota bacterium]